MKQLVLTVAAVALLGWVTPAQATPITYEISGMASGQIGGTTFTDALVELTGIGDTSHVVTGVFGFADAEQLATTTVTIQGVGTATITVPTEILSTVLSVSLDTGFPTLPYVVIGRIDLAPGFPSITGIGFIGSPTLLGYDLTTPIGTLTASPGGIGFPPLCGTLGHDPCVQTTLGALSFNSNFSPTTQGTLTVTPVPEPATLTLTWLGLAGIVTRYRRRRSNSLS